MKIAGVAAVLMAAPILVSAADKAPPSGAQSPHRDASGRTPAPTRALVEQKAALLLRLLGDAPSTERIGASGNTEAKANTASAARCHEKALALLDAGELAGADVLLSEGIALMAKARKLVPDSSSNDHEHRARYLQLRDSTQSLSAAHERQLARAGAVTRPRIDAERHAIDEALFQARSLGAVERYSEAIQVLARTERMLLQGMSAALGTATLDSTRHFSGPREEYEYELERNRDYAGLIPIALAELKTPEDARRIVAAQVSRSSGMRDAARLQAEAQDYQAALQNVRESTVLLQRALAAAGLTVPKE